MLIVKIINGDKVTFSCIEKDICKNLDKIRMTVRPPVYFPDALIGEGNVGILKGL